MILEVGKKYRTRDGETIIRITEREYGEFWEYIGRVEQTSGIYFNRTDVGEFTSNGHFMYPGDQHPNDLVEEVTD